MRITFKVRDGMLDSYSVNKKHNYPFGIFIHNDEYYVNTITTELTKITMLLIIKEFYRLKNSGNKYYQYRGLSNNLIKQINDDVGITIDELKELLK